MLFGYSGGELLLVDMMLLLVLGLFYFLIGLLGLGKISFLWLCYVDLLFMVGKMLVFG